MIVPLDAFFFRSIIFDLTALFILLMCMNYIAMQVSPTHICLTMCSEDYHIPLGALMWKTLPMVAVMTLFSFVYYFLLTLAGL